MAAPRKKKPDQPTFIDLFAGIGGIRLAFESAGAKCLFSSEWDKYACKTYVANFPGDKPHGDIRQIDPRQIPDHDILTAGFPCQPFSIAGVTKHNALGNAHGFRHATQGTMFFEVARIIAEKKPKAFFLENVKNLRRHDNGRTFITIRSTLEALGYDFHWDVISSKKVLPQNRERIYMVGFRKTTPDEMMPFVFPRFRNRRPAIGQILQPRAPSKYILSDHLWMYLQAYARKHKAKGNGFGFGLVKRDGIARTLSARYHKDGGEILINRGSGRNPRRLTPRECARLMGFPDWFDIVCSDTRAYQQFGNSVAVPVVEKIARSIVQCLDGEMTELQSSYQYRLLEKSARY